ncbi:MAG: sugar ABC transporter permease, partial [Candidatus Eisenbacteria bacterium]|nr:sugar ABC transporter permease [Candidatus Eisenbacteria bacterium]
MRRGEAQTAVVDLPVAARMQRRRLLKRMWLLYVLMLPGILQLFVFRYLPIYGLLIAFKDYRYHLGILGSPWNDFAHFKTLFVNPYVWRVLRNTVVISVLRIVFGFPAPIVFALLLNELKSTTFKRVVQSISYLPHFLSWVVLAGIFVEILSPQRGIVGYVWSLFGKTPPLLLTKSSAFRPILIVTGVWQGVGWGSIIYLASITSIDPALYDAARIDGANRFQQAVYVTVPSLIPVMTILFILGLGSILNAGFD